MIGCGACLGEIAGACVDGRTGKARHKAGALLVVPDDYLNGPREADRVVLECFKCFECRKHTEGTIKPAAEGLGVGMRATGCRGCARIASWAADEHIADIIDFDAEAPRDRPVCKLAMGPDVEVVQSEAVYSAAFGCASAGEFHVALPNAIGVDSGVVHHHSTLFFGPVRDR